jgi:phosphoribosyl 1,2-cyclic phosphodiesterase
MALFVASLNSGSNGNCYYIANQDTAILVDAGISCKETEKRMKRIGLSIKKVKAIFITHEHTDHIYGVQRLSKRHQLPVYITPATLQHGRLSIEEHLIKSFQTDEVIQVDKLSITAIHKIHDAIDAHSFVISDGDVRIGVFTDIGAPCENLINHFSQCHAAFLETNYDEDMLENGSYPWILKNRIRGGKGHLSNKQAAEIFVNHRPRFMSHLFLSHLSRNNNTPKKAKELFEAIADNTKIVLASRNEETALYQIRSSYKVNVKTIAGNFQLQLF